MTHKILSLVVCIGFSTSLWVLGTSAAQAIPMPVPGDPGPGPADIGRIKPEERLPASDHSHDEDISVPAFNPDVQAPEGAKSIHFTLNTVKIEGMTAFSNEEMADIYSQYIGKDITLDVAYTMAKDITERYRNAGYFLSLAYVPVQHIKNGIITIHVVEGYVAKVELPEQVSDYSVINGYVNWLTAQKPVTSDAVESFLLRLSDLPGISFRAILSPVDNDQEGVMKLTLSLIPKEGKGSITLDNYSSRFLGPNEGSATYSTSILPLQQTTISGLSSLPTDKLYYGFIDHTVTVAPDFTVEVSGGDTKSFPGYSLEKYDIESISSSESVALNYQWIRQRQENLALKFTFDSRDVTSDILHTALTRDYIRAFRGGLTFDLSDSWNGYNTVSATVSHGLAIFGARAKDDPESSRTGALPDFNKAELSVSRLQSLNTDWALYGAVSGQLSSGVLYSSEQFGYGGLAFGRAYDSSEITGDDGIEESLEIRYNGLSDWDILTTQPYAFYDIGTVWNGAIGQPKKESAASAGAGIRFTTEWHETGNLGLAFPLTKDIGTPIYGHDPRGPRILLQITQGF